MNLQHDSTKPIYVQIAEWLETEILSGEIAIHEKVHSQYQLADRFNINPATAAKGLNLLADDEILYKKRGLGMFVEENAPVIILEKRKNENLKKLAMDFVKEADYLNVSTDELFEMIRNIRKEEE